MQEVIEGNLQSPKEQVLRGKIQLSVARVFSMASEKSLFLAIYSDKRRDPPICSEFEPKFMHERTFNPLNRSRPAEGQRDMIQACHLSQNRPGAGALT